MARFTILTVLALAACSFAQVTVTNTGFATTPGPAVPGTPVSPPIVYTPIIQLGQGPTQPITAVAEQPEVTNPTLAPASMPSPFNFGAAQFDTSAGSGSVGHDFDGKSLGEIAREQKHRPAPANARMFTNSDIDKLNQTGGSVSSPSLQANRNDNWTPNNGVINPAGPANAQPNAVAAPSQPNQTPTGNQTPFQPKPQSENYSPAGIGSDRQPVELAQNNPPAPAQDQEAPSQVQASSSQSEPSPAQASQLPRTASRLPLVGVAGLFSVTMGIFVRYQRAKAR